MSKLISTDKEYAAWVADLKHRFRSAQIKAAVKVNRELLIYYWQLGRDMVNMIGCPVLCSNINSLV